MATLQDKDRDPKQKIHVGTSPTTAICGETGNEFSTEGFVRCPECGRLLTE